MTAHNNQGLMMNDWHKLPNIVTDELIGDVISTNAGWVVVLVWRLTEGISGRTEAYIPVERFKRILGTSRDKTAHKYINEAIASGLIHCIKESGKTNRYSINKKCPLWHRVDEVKPVAENACGLVDAKSATSGEKCHKVVAENAPATSGENRHTYKDIIIKENIKENICSNHDEKKYQNPNPKQTAKKSSTVTKPESVSQQVWDDLLTLRKTNRAPLTVTAWKPIAKQLEQAQQATDHTLDQIITEWITNGWRGFKCDWYLNRIKSTQEQNHANNQTNRSQHQSNQRNKSDAEIMHERNMADYDAWLAELAQESCEPTANQNHFGSVYDVEKIISNENEKS